MLFGSILVFRVGETRFAVSSLCASGKPMEVAEARQTCELFTISLGICELTLEWIFLGRGRTRVN